VPPFILVSYNVMKPLKHFSKYIEWNIPASYGSMKVNNELFFLGSKTIMLEVWSEIVGPS